MKTILFGTDFSENSIRGLNYAYFLKEKLNARLVITHIGDTCEIVNNTYVSNSQNFKKMVQQYKIFSMYKLMEYVSNNLSSTDPLSNTFFEVRTDISPDIGINEVAKAYKADLILTGLNGKNHSHHKKRYLGNNVQSLVYKAPCPVLATPYSGNQAFSVKNIVYFSNFEIEEIEVIKYLLTWAHLLNANVTIMHVSAENDPLIKNKKMALKTKIEQEGVNASWSLKSIIANTPMEGLNYIMDNEMVDIISFFENQTNQWVDKFYHKDLVKANTKFPPFALLAFNKKNVRNFSKEIFAYSSLNDFNYAPVYFN